LVSQSVALLVLKRWRSLRNHLLSLGVVGLAALLIWPLMVSTAKSVSADLGRASLAQNLFLAAWNFWGYTFHAQIVSSSLLKAAIVGVLATCLGVIVIRNRRAITSLNWVIWLITFVLFTSYVLVFTLSGAQLATRYLSALFVPQSLSIFAGVGLLKTIPRARTLLLMTLLVTCFNIASLFALFSPLAKSGDYVRIATFLSAQERPRQPIVVFNAEAAEALAHYYRGANQIIPLPKPLDFKTYDLLDFVIPNQQAIATAISQVAGQPEEIWLVQVEPCRFAGVDFNCEALQSFVSQNYTVKLSQAFYGAKVERLQRLASSGK
jgi:hypothetical protein